MSKQFIGLVLFLAALGIGLGLLAPRVTTVRAKVARHKAMLALIEAKKQRIEALQQLTTTFAGQTDRVSRLISTLPQDPEIPEQLVTIEAMAKDAGITVQSLVPQNNTQAKEIVTTVVGEGELGAVERFMQAIADNSRPLSVRTVSLTRGNQNKVAYTITIAAPYIGKVREAN